MAAGATLPDHGRAGGDASLVVRLVKASDRHADDRAKDWTRRWMFDIPCRQYRDRVLLHRFRNQGGRKSKKASNGDVDVDVDQPNNHL